MRKDVTFSALARADECAEFPWLEHSPVPESEASEGGNIKHEFMCNCLLLGREAALRVVHADYLDECSAIEIDELPAGRQGEFIPEVAFAWDWETDTARELFRGRSDREYGELGASEIAGTVDVVGLTEDATVVVDYKTGTQQLPSPEKSLQLLAGAVAASRAYGRQRAFVGYIRILGDGTSRTQWAELNQRDLWKAAQRIRAVMQRVVLRQGELKENYHCKFCPALQHCPLKKQLAVRLDKETQMTEASALFPFPLTEENFPAFLSKLEIAEALVERLRAAAKEFGKEKARPLPDGWAFGPVAEIKESINPDKGYEVLAKLYGEKVAEEALEVKEKITKNNLKRVLREHVKGKPYSKVEDETLEAMRKEGATSITRIIHVKRHIPNGGGK